MNDLDRKAAVVVMGWRFEQGGETFKQNPISIYDHWQDSEGKFICYPEDCDFHPSTNIQQALGDGGPGTVVGRMRELGWRMSLMFSTGDKEEPGFVAMFDKNRFERMTDWIFNTNPAAAIVEAAVRTGKGDDDG